MDWIQQHLPLSNIRFHRKALNRQTIKTNACTQFLVAIKIYKLRFLKKLLFRDTPLLSGLVLSSHMGDKLHIWWKDWCHRSLLYTLPITSLNTKLRFSSTVNNKSRKQNIHTYPKEQYRLFQTSPPKKLFRMCFKYLLFEAPENRSQLWNPTQRELQSPMNGRAQTILQPRAAVV